MSDFELSVVVSRTQLALPDLELNDNRYYRVAKLLGGSVAWAREQVESAYIDGAVTTHRHLQMVTETLEVDVLPRSSLTYLQTIQGNLVRALRQDDFVLTVDIDGAHWAYQCEAADISSTWSTDRIAAHRGYVTASIPRQPNPLAGRY